MENPWELRTPEPFAQEVDGQAGLFPGNYDITEADTYDITQFTHQLPFLPEINNVNTEDKQTLLRAISHDHKYLGMDERVLMDFMSDVKPFEPDLSEAAKGFNLEAFLPQTDQLEQGNSSLETFSDLSEFFIPGNNQELVGVEPSVTKEKLKRIKNNEASKISRARRKQRMVDLEVERERLECRNQDLISEEARLQRLVEHYKSQLVTMVANK